MRSGHAILKAVWLGISPVVLACFANLPTYGLNLASAASASSCFPPPTSCRISSRFGNRFHPVEKVWKLHRGTDFACGIGTPLVSVENGAISRATYDVGGGNYVVVRGESGREFKYMHMSHIAEIAARMSPVAQGTLIGQSGNTGKWTTGPHLHFEAWSAGSAVDPERFICGASPRPEGEMGEPSSHENPAAGSAAVTNEPDAPMGLDGSLEAVMDNIISSRAFNPDYASQLSTLGKERLYAELAYLEAASLKIKSAKQASLERLETMHALRQILLTDQHLKPALKNQVLVVKGR